MNADGGRQFVNSDQRDQRLVISADVVTRARVLRTERGFRLSRRRRCFNTVFGRFVCVAESHDGIFDELVEILSAPVFGFEESAGVIDS